MKTSALAEISRLLESHRIADEAEEVSVARTASFLQTHPNPFSRQTLDGHLTASAIVLDARGCALLLFHARLKRWLQPGGHVENSDDDLQAAALREAREESGLGDLLLDPALLDVDVHLIPENRGKQEPAHWHHDLCFVARTMSSQSTRINPEESHAFRWIDPRELASLPIDPVVRRRIEKAWALNAGHVVERRHE